MNTPIPPHVLERVLANVDRRGDDECWLWTGGSVSPRSGHVTVHFNGRTIAAHRAVYVGLVGPYHARKAAER